MRRLLTRLGVACLCSGLWGTACRAQGTPDLVPKPKIYRPLGGTFEVSGAPLYVPESRDGPRC